MAALVGLTTLACAPATPPPPPTPPTPHPPTPFDAPRVPVHADGSATALAAALVVPGSAWEDARSSGLTLLAARTLLAAIRPRLDSLGAIAAVDCDRAAFTFSLIAPPGSGPRALDLFLDAIFDPRAGAAVLEDARRELRASLLLDQANPAWQARLAARQALLGDGDGGEAWTRPACGVPETLSLFDIHDVRIVADYRFRPERATLALVGAVGPAMARDLTQRYPALIQPPVPLPAPPDARPGRRYVERNTVTAWVSVSFRFGSGVDAETVRLLGALLVDATSPSMERPGLYAVSSEVVEDGGGGVLIVHAVTTPEAAGEAASGVEAAAAAWAAGAEPAPLERARSRHRGVRLRELAAPEVRARWLALGAARGEPGVGGWPGESAWTASAVRAAARSLSAPARSVVGPRAARGAAVP